MSKRFAGSPIPKRLAELLLPAIEPLPRKELEALSRAGAEILECHRVLGKAGLNVVGEVLRGQGEFVEFEHYPHDDVFDDESHAQYYYHAHRSAVGEHGHFHLFLREEGIPDALRDRAVRGTQAPEPLVHLIAISMDGYGLPIGLFAVNRWVTGDIWYRAEDVIALLDRFVIDHAYPSWPVNRWITAMVRLFRREIEALLRHRDIVLDDWARTHPGSDLFEDRELELTGYLPISVDETILGVRAALGQHSAR